MYEKHKKWTFLVFELINGLLHSVSCFKFLPIIEVLLKWKKLKKSTKMNDVKTVNLHLISGKILNSLFSQHCFFFGFSLIFSVNFKFNY